MIKQRRDELIILLSTLPMQDKNNRPYIFTTQNLSYISDLKKKTGLNQCITILGSSDPIFELINNGAKKITAVDFNPLQEIVYYLKKAALATLSLNQYLAFFFCDEQNNQNKFSIRLYEIIRNGFLPEEADYKSIWDNFFNSYITEIDLQRYFKFGISRLNPLQEPMHLSYLDKNNYYRLRDAINEQSINVVIDDIFEFLQTIEASEYDYVDITNSLLLMAQLIPMLFAQILSIIEKFIAQMNSGVFVVDYLFGMSFAEVKMLSDLHNFNGKIHNDPSDSKMIYASVYQMLSRKIITQNIDMARFSEKMLIDGHTDSLMYVLK